MAPLTVLCLGLGLTPQTSHYTLSLDRESFVVGGGEQSERYPLSQEEKAAPKYIAYRKDDSFAVWDHRGLTLRKGAIAKSFRLDEIPLSPKLFEPEEIESAKHEAEQGKLSLAAAGLAGSKRIGQRVFFLVRWDGIDKHPGFEALLQVDLDAVEMKPFLLGKVEGTTGSTSPVDDRLFLVNDGIAAVTKRPSDWGISIYSFSSKSFDFISLGQKLDTWYPSGLYLETTPYETKVGGFLDRDSLQSSRLFEDRGTMDWLDGKFPAIAIKKGLGEKILRNCDSGLEQSFSDQAEIRRTKSGILAWSPPLHPRHAVLLGYSNWNKLAVWSGTSSKPPHPNTHPKQ